MKTKTMRPGVRVLLVPLLLALLCAPARSQDAERPKHESPVYRVGPRSSLEEVEAPTSLFASGVRPEQTVTVIVPLRHMETGEAVNTLANLTRDSELRLWEVSGRQQLVFSGKAKDVEHAMRFLAAIDVPADEPERIVKIIQVEWTDARQLAILLEQFVLQRATPPRPGRVRGPVTSSRGTHLTIDQRTNKIIVQTHSEQDLRDIEMLVAELDTRDPTQKPADPGEQGGKPSAKEDAPRGG